MSDFTRNLALYDQAVAGADTWDKRRFDAHLLGGLLASVDHETARRLIEAAAADVNGGQP